MKNIKNRTLLIIFGILGLVVLFFFLYDSKKGERSFRSELFTIDSARVSRVTIYPKLKNSQPLVLSGQGRNWKIALGSQSWPADTAMVSQVIGSLLSARTERVAATDKSSWKELEITDSSSTRVVVEQGNEMVADFRIGKLNVSQGGRGGYGRQGISVKSNIRIAGDDKVYVVDGFFSMVFSENVASYRFRQVCQFDRNKVNKLTFMYPGDSSFMIQKSDGRWMAGDKPVDSANTVNFINSLANLANTQFAPDNEIPALYSCTLKIEGQDMAPVELQGAINSQSGQYFVKSSQNATAVFGGAGSSLYRQLFPGRSKFEPTAHKEKPVENKGKPGTSKGKPALQKGKPVKGK